MKKLEPKKKEEAPVNTPANPEPPKPEPVKDPIKTKEKPDYTWVWVLVGLLSAIAVVYFMNINKPENGNPEPQK